jgi:hypothetical protein
MASREELRRKLKEYDNHTYKDTIAYKAQINKIKSMDDGSAKDKEITYLKEDLIPFLKLSIDKLRAYLKNSLRLRSRSRSKSKSKSRSKSKSATEENMVVEKTQETDAAKILISMSKGTNPGTPIETNPSESPKTKKARWAGGYRKRTSKSIHSKINKYFKLFSV